MIWTECDPGPSRGSNLPDVQRTISQIKPGFSGIGSIIFRGEEDILGNRDHALDSYDRVVAPSMGDVEAWYLERKTTGVYFALILLTVLVVCVPRSRVVWDLFKDLPTPPDSLKKNLNYFL